MLNAISRIQAIGNSMAKILDCENVDDNDFARIAERLLLDSSDIEGVDLLGAVDFLASELAPEQFDWRFSDFPVVIYRHRRFYIELLYWIHATTAIHEHSFSGAFMVVSGSSIHSRYAIKNLVSVADDLFLCDSVFLGSEYLRRGAVRRIDSGVDGLVHGLFHLDVPSVSLVIRTNGHSANQYSLARPRLWWNQLGLARNRRLSLIERASFVSEKADRGAGRNLLASVANRLTDAEWVWLALRWVGYLSDRKWFAELLFARHSTCDAINSALLDGYDCVKTENLLTSARESIQDPELRYLLALLMNVPDRNQLLRLVAQRTNCVDPVSVVADWLARIATHRGDLRERMARMAAASGVDHRLGVLIRESLPTNISFEESALLIAGALQLDQSYPARQEAIERIRSAFTSEPTLSILVP